ncbi:MAG: cytochrome b6-f complex iron-sulfur subunit [Thermomicrobiales bacterium]|jgi:cytochrome b6-f complex iron-sulfur subunit|nr:cytochrome b6-f complex iron-sulfur subunit [Thermomicrobiales bacterium]
MRSLFRTVFGLFVGGLVGRLLGLLGRFHVGPAPRSRTVTRRGFVRNAALGAVLIIVAEIGAGFVRFFWPNKTTAFGQALDIPATDVPEVNGTPFRYTPGKFYLVHNQDGVMALYQKCPHLGCAVPYNGPAESDRAFACPCHGSLYDYNGTRTGGPAPRSMDYMAVEVKADGSVTVNTGDIRERAAYDKTQAVRYPA